MTPDTAVAMSSQGMLILLLWFLACIVFMLLMAPVRAVTWGYLGAMLLLPTGRAFLPGMPDIDKWQMAGLGLTVGALLFRCGMVAYLRLAATDWLLLAFLTATAVTSLDNELGFYDAGSTILRMYLVFGAPYLLMRVFCRTRQDILYVVQAIILAAALYAVPALWEFRMSPQMHRVLYGYSGQGWREHYRHGFYRPLLFFEHGIPLAFFFAAAATMSIYLYLRGVLRPTWGVPSIGLVGLTGLGTLISMTYGAYFAFIVALAALAFSPRGRLRYCGLIPMVVAIGWSTARYADLVDVHPLIQASYSRFAVARAQSFEYRLLADGALLAHARERPLVGWGGWNRNRSGVTDKWGQPIAIDALWVDMVGKYGLVGLGLFYAWFVTAAVMGMRCLPRIASPMLQAVTYALAMMVGLEMINWQLNGFVNPTVLLGTALLTTTAQRTQTADPAAKGPWDGRLDHCPELQHA